MNFIESIVAALACAALLKYYLHMLQLESYQLDGYVRWCKKNRSRALGWPLGVGLAGGALQLIARWAVFPLNEAAGHIARALVLAAFAAAVAGQYRFLHGQPSKRPFALTARMKRLCAMTALALAALVAILSWAGAPLFAFAGLAGLPLAAGFLIQPIERAINDGYRRQAFEKLKARPDLIKIGITGSFGKTTTKFALATILSEKYRVLASPASFNTPMGLTKVIREQLTDDHEVFIAEMGARHVGDIAELMALVGPRYGVLTSVGPQHLETFGDVETVADTKFELIEGLPGDGIGFFAADGGEVDKLYRRARCEKYRAGIGGDGLAMRAEEVQVGSFGSRFLLIDGEGHSIACQTKLLGRHNIQNIALCAAVARKLGLSMEQIAAGIAKMEPVEHRLQLIPGANGMLIIDDAYNSNPAGARAALDVLAQFEGRRIIVTPGMVELGERERQFNHSFGRQIAQCCEIAILVGAKRTQPIAEGLREAGMNADSIHIVKTLDEAAKVLGRVGLAGDVVLFENDLPDNYAE